METLKRLIPLLLVTAALLGLYWWQSREPAEPELQTTTAPATKPTTSPTTEPTTQPTTQPPTEYSPPEWLMEPEYPSYEELFSEDVPYSNFSYSWILEQDGNYTEYFFAKQEMGDFQVCSSSGEAYKIPNGENLEKEYGRLGYMGCDGKYAYLYNIAREEPPEAKNTILQLELETGEVEILVQETRLYGAPGLRAGCVVYYVRATEMGGELCRLYVPEMRLDVLCQVEHPEFVFKFAYPSSTLGTFGWEGISAEALNRAIEEWENPESSYKIWAPGKDKNPDAQTLDFSKLWDWWNQGEKPKETYSRDGLEVFFHEFQENTGIWALERIRIEPVTGAVTKTAGSLDNCFLGSSFGHDHFDPVYEPLPVPKAIMGPWQSAPGWEIREQIPDTSCARAYAIRGKLRGSDHYQLFAKSGDRMKLLVDAPWELVESTDRAFYCLTEEGVLVELSHDGKICNTLFDPQGKTLRSFKYCDGMLAFREDSRTVLLELATGQYRVLMDGPEVFIEMWVPGDSRFCFSVSKGLYYQQYLFDINTGMIEKTFVL